jgi:hypothetical protein
MTVAILGSGVRRLSSCPFLRTAMRSILCGLSCSDGSESVRRFLPVLMDAFAGYLQMKWSFQPTMTNGFNP